MELMAVLRSGNSPGPGDLWKLREDAARSALFHVTHRLGPMLAYGGKLSASFFASIARRNTATDGLGSPFRRPTTLADRPSSGVVVGGDVAQEYHKKPLQADLAPPFFPFVQKPTVVWYTHPHHHAVCLLPNFPPGCPPNGFAHEAIRRLVEVNELQGQRTRHRYRFG